MPRMAITVTLQRGHSWDCGLGPSALFFFRWEQQHLLWGAGPKVHTKLTSFGAGCRVRAEGRCMEPRERVVSSIHWTSLARAWPSVCIWWVCLVWEKPVFREFWENLSSCSYPSGLCLFWAYFWLDQNQVFISCLPLLCWEWKSVFLGSLCPKSGRKMQRLFWNKNVLTYVCKRLYVRTYISHVNIITIHVLLQNVFYMYKLYLNKICTVHIDLVVVQLPSHVNSLRPHGLQHTSLPSPSLSPRLCSNSCPLNQWCHPTISSSVIPFSSCLQSLPASGSFQWLDSLHQVAKGLELQLQHQSF